ncbi:MAG: hypothetical protein Kow00129_15380 [Thermoleophilia bacterium]
MPSLCKRQASKKRLVGPPLVMADAVKNRFIAEEIDRTKQVLYAA